MADAEVIRCPFCDDEGQPVLDEDGWTARQCAICALLFVSPRPSASAVTRIYAEDEAHFGARTHIASFKSVHARLEARRVVRLLESFTRPGRLLEVGPGSGSILHAARRRKWTVGAVELNPEQAMFIRDALAIPCWPSLEDAEGTWDVVYHRDVLSHFHDPVNAFRAVHHLLAPGGLHVFESGSGDFDRRYDRLFSTFQFPDHLFFFSRASLDLLLDRSGFDLVSIRSYSLVPLLRLEKLVSRVRGAPTAGDEVGKGVVARRSGRSGGVRSAVRTALTAARYGSLFGLGRLPPKARRPLHMLVVARRR